jgi:hypothetical protein
VGSGVPLHSRHWLPDGRGIWFLQSAVAYSSRHPCFALDTGTGIVPNWFYQLIGTMFLVALSIDFLTHLLKGKIKEELM